MPTVRVRARFMRVAPSVTLSALELRRSSLTSAYRSAPALSAAASALCATSAPSSATALALSARSTARDASANSETS